MKTLILALAALLGALTASPACAQYVEGQDYVALTPRVASPTGKIEVLSVFKYGSGASAQTENSLTVWSRRMPGDVILTRIPGIFSQREEAVAHAWYALGALRQQDKLGPALLQFGVMGRGTMDPNRWAEFVRQQGLDPAAATQAYDSFGAMDYLRTVGEVRDRNHLGVAPALIVGGRYRLQPSSPAETQKLLDFVIAKVRADRAAGR